MHLKQNLWHALELTKLNNCLDTENIHFTKRLHHYIDILIEIGKEGRHKPSWSTSLTRENYS